MFLFPVWVHLFVLIWDAPFLESNPHALGERAKLCDAPISSVSIKKGTTYPSSPKCKIFRTLMLLDGAQCVTAGCRMHVCVLSAHYVFKFCIFVVFSLEHGFISEP